MFENSTEDPLDNDEAGVMRWLPPMVVIGVVTGFVALAWYAYHAGTQSVKDEDLLVVEAEKTPIKEKPVDAGGMQFPNQDKTIFDTFANGIKQPPKVERVLPTPEEPVKGSADTSETTGWINDKYHQKKDGDKTDTAKTEQVIAPVNSGEMAKKSAVAESPVSSLPPVSKEFQVAAVQPQPDAEQPASYVAKASDNNVTAPAPAQPKEEKKKSVKKESAAAAPANKADNGEIKVQLGAYRSEKEAQDAWDVIQKKHADLLAVAQPAIIKVNLGTKGIYYRLRVGGFASADEAGAVCGKLVAAGQPCIVPTK